MAAKEELGAKELHEGMEIVRKKAATIASWIRNSSHFIACM